MLSFVMFFTLGSTPIQSIPIIYVFSIVLYYLILFFINHINKFSKSLTILFNIIFSLFIFYSFLCGISTNERFFYAFLTHGFTKGLTYFTISIFLFYTYLYIKNTFLNPAYINIKDTDTTINHNIVNIYYNNILHYSIIIFSFYFSFYIKNSNIHLILQLDKIIIVLLVLFFIYNKNKLIFTKKPLIIIILNSLFLILYVFIFGEKTNKILVHCNKLEFIFIFLNCFIYTYLYLKKNK